MYDTFGIEKLEQCLNLSLKEIKIQSFIFDNVETTVYRLYLKFNNWLSLFFDDGVLFIKDENPETINTNDIDEVDYPFLEKAEFADIYQIIGKKLISFEIKDFSIKFIFEGMHDLVFFQPETKPGFFGDCELKLVSK